MSGSISFLINLWAQFASVRFGSKRRGFYVCAFLGWLRFYHFSLTFFSRHLVFIIR